MLFLKWWQALKQNRMVAFALFVCRRFYEERVPQVAASLTFTTLLALVPVLTVVVAAASVFPVFDEWSAELAGFINRTIVPQGADLVFDYLNAFQERANKLTVIGSVMLLVTSLMLVQTIDSAFNHIWRVSTRRPLLMQFLVYWALLSFGPLLLGVGASLLFGVMKNSAWVAQYPLLAQWLQPLPALVLGTLLLWGLFRFVPNRYVPARHALIGAFVTALCLETARFVFGWYAGTFNGYASIYGAFAALPFFLLWLNLLWTLLLAGAVFTSSLSYWQGEAFRRNIDARGRFDDVLKILLVLEQAQQNGRAVPVHAFRSHINMGYDELGELLEKLARHGYVYCGKQGWVLKTAASAIALDDLFCLFVYRPGRSRTPNDEVNAAIAGIMQPCVDAMNMSLAEFSRRTQAEHAAEAQGDGAETMV